MHVEIAAQVSRPEYRGIQLASETDFSLVNCPKSPVVQKSLSGHRVVSKRFEAGIIIYINLKPDFIVYSTKIGRIHAFGLQVQRFDLRAV
jgi:hypothetical protein